MNSSPFICVKGASEAVALYQEAFGLTIGMTDLWDDGLYRHVSLMSGETEIISLNEDRYNNHYDIADKSKLPFFAINVAPLGTREAVDHAYNVLSAEARVNENPNGPESPDWDNEGSEYWFSLVDKFGVYWGVGK